MYHIKSDKRSQTSAILITNAFKKCLEYKDYSEITITDIQRESTVSRSTFYRLFDCMDDVVIYLCDKTFEHVIEEFQFSEHKDLYTIALLFVTNWMKEDKILQLAISIHREDILFNCHMKHFEEIHTIVKENSPNNYFSSYHISFLCSMMVGTLSTWIKEGKKENPTELVQCISYVLDDFYHLMTSNKNGAIHPSTPPK